MRRATIISTLSALIIFLLFLSTLASILTGYTKSPPSNGKEKKTPSGHIENEDPILLFKVSPATPQLYWRTLSADYYTGLNWFKTTEEEAREPSEVQPANATEIFTVEIERIQPEILLALPSANSTQENLLFESPEDLLLYADALGNDYKVIRTGQAIQAKLVYNVLWYDVKTDDKLISLENIPDAIQENYLQLPDISEEVWKTAKDLEDSSFSVLDQILADIQFLRTKFVYDSDYSRYTRDNLVDIENSWRSLNERISQGSDVSAYMERRKGVCIDAATALAIILRIQKIPARISIGYKPDRMEQNKLLYYTTGAHAVTEVYLPPYGWTQFDATPPTEENPGVQVLPFKKISSPGSRVFCQLSITNRYSLMDYFTMTAYDRQEWNTTIAPEELRIEPLQTAYALLEATIPQDAETGEKHVVTITVSSVGRRRISFSILAIIQVGNISHTPTTTSVGDFDATVARQNTFWVNGSVLAESQETVENMTVCVLVTQGTEAEGIIIGKGNSKHGTFQIQSNVSLFMEIGDYRMFLISLGTSRYAPSRSDYIIRVLATTIMDLGPEEDFVLGYGAIHGRLSLDNGTGLADAPISLEVTSLDAPSESWKSQNLTFTDGTFRIETTFENPGTYEIEALFPGNDFIAESHETRVIELERSRPEIFIHAEKAAVRGEAYSVTGTIRSQNIGIWGETLTLTFDDRLLTTLETRENGSYTFSFNVDSEEKLGPHTLAASLAKENISSVHSILVKSKTRITAEVSDVAGGMFLLFSASLSDDHDQPIQGAKIAVENYGLSWKTDASGNLSLLLDTVKLWPQNLVLSAKFEGSDLYMPATTEDEVVLDPLVSLPFLLPLAASTSIAIVLVYARHHLRRIRAFRPASGVKVEMERKLIEDETVQPLSRMTQPLKILLPEIDAQFPNVWGVKDKLRAEIVLDKSHLERIQKREVEFCVDQEKVASVPLSQQGRAKLTHSFIEKGEHQMQAILQSTFEQESLEAETKLRVVVYGEEIIRLYNEFLAGLASRGLPAQKEMTAREIEGLILRSSDCSPEAINKVTTCFEKAEYSNHLGTRKDYEHMYLSLKELNIDVEQKE